MRTKAYSGLLIFVVISACFADTVDDDVTIETIEDTDIAYDSPKPIDESKVYFAEHFDDPASFNKNWIKSEAKKEGIEEDIAKYDGEWGLESPQKDGFKGDLGLVLKSKAKHAAIAAPLSKPFEFKDKPLIVQYEVLLQEGQECGGAYLKLLTQVSDAKTLKHFHDKTPYSIMFGPDKCGNDHKLHFIFKHKNPKNGSVQEKHCEKPKERLEETFSDKLPHLYTLILRPDNTFEIQVDKKTIKSGSLLEDFLPPVNPPAEIEDPNDKKPEDWDEREKIPDPNAVKPDDWDEDAPAQIVDESAVMPDGWLENEPTHLPDPTAKKPADWDTEMDGEWEPPLIENPACANALGCGPWEPPLINNPAFKGKWRAPLIDNPNYKGKWRPRKIPNPHYFEDKEPFKMQPIDAVGFELWSMSKDILFDNIIITEEIEVAKHWASETFDKKRQKIASDSASVWGRIMKSLNYNPEGWGLYFVYCAVPVVFYVYYIYRCVQEESVVQKLANVTNEYPILWLVYIIVLGIPVVFVLYLCCKPSASRSQEAEELKQAAEKKKTDEPTADNEEAANEDAKITEVNEEEDDEEGKDDDDAEKNSNPDSDDDNEAVEDSEQAPGGGGGGGEGTRKRKVRKE